VPRPALLRRLRAAPADSVLALANLVLVLADSVLVLLHGPTGIGKTALRTELAATEPVAWPSLDAHDNDPAGPGRPALAGPPPAHRQRLAHRQRQAHLRLTAPRPRAQHRTWGQPGQGTATRPNWSR
jgi:hypothetical protein